MGESGAPGLVVVGLFVALLALGVVRGLLEGEDGETGGAVPAETTSTTRAASPSLTATTRTLVETTEEPDREPAEAEASPFLAAPVGPGLPPQLASEAQAMATEVLRADVSGEGRERFAGYWGEGLYRPCCRNVVVHTSVARAVEGREETVVVSLVWSAERLDAGPPRELVQTDVYLIEQEGAWVPVRPAEGGA